MKNKKYFKLLSNYLKDEKIKIIIYIILYLSLTIPTIVIPYYFGLSLDYLIKQDIQNFLKCILISWLFTIICYNFVSLKINLIYFKIEQNVSNKLVKDLYQKVSNLKVISFENTGVGEFTNKIYLEPKKIIELFFSYFDGIYCLLEIIVISIVIFNTSIILGLEMLLLTLVMYFIAKKYIPKMKENQKNLSEYGDTVMKNTTETLQGIREIKALGIKSLISHQQNNKLDSYTNQNYQVNKLSNYYQSINNFIFDSAKLLIILTLAYLFINQKINIALYLMIQNYTWNLQRGTEKISKMATTHSKIIISLKRISEILNDNIYEEEKFGTINLTNSKGKIEFKNVSFKYTENEENIISNLSTTFEPNKINAIIGKSGNGKTTIFNLLLRYFDQTEGQITIDGTNIQNLTEESLRNTISIIRQQPFLFNKTIKENLQIINPNITDQEIKIACQKAYIHDYIMSLKDGYNTLIGEGGVNLSGGQKQRIAIARALLQNTKIILFDEATSALDNTSQQYIKQTIDKLKTDHTIIIIAHRLSTIKDADNIYIMENNTITTKSNHQQLIKNNKIYQELYKNEKD